MKKRKKLKLEELRIGNYVYYNQLLIKIDRSFFAKYIQNELPKKSIYSIELTSKFLDNTTLVKYGNNNYEFWYNSAFNIQYVKDNWEIYFIGESMSKRIKYVHEFQNFYYEITGEML